MTSLLAGSPRPSSGYCSSDDELNFLFNRTSSDLATPTSGSPSSSSVQSSDGASCPVTPDSVTSEVKFPSGLGLFESDLELDAGFLSFDLGLEYGCSSFGNDAIWLRPPLLDDLGLDLVSEIPSGTDGDGVSQSKTVFLEQYSFVGASPGVAAIESGSDCLRSALPVLGRLSGDEISLQVTDGSTTDESVVRQIRLPSNRGSHGNATTCSNFDNRSVAMTTTASTATNGVKTLSNKRTIRRSVDVADDVIEDVTAVPSSDVTEPTTCHVLSDHRYSSSPRSLGPPPSKLSRTSADPRPVRASILATLLLTKEPLRANAGSDAQLALNRSPDPPQRCHHSRRTSMSLSARTNKTVLEDMLTQKHCAQTTDVVQTTSSITRRRTSYSCTGSLKNYDLYSDYLLMDNGNRLDIELTPEDGSNDPTSATSQVCSLELDNLFTQQVEPDDLWMHLSDLL